MKSFVLTGPKSYSYVYGNGKQKSAIKGFTLDYENSSILNHDSLTKIVRKEIKDLTVVNERKITRKERDIVNKYVEKTFKLGYDKRVIRYVNENHIDTVPYGY